MKWGVLRWSVRLALLGGLAGLLAYAWMIDRPSPAYPYGQFGELIVIAMVAVGLTGAAVFGWRALRR